MIKLQRGMCVKDEYKKTDMTNAYVTCFEDSASLFRIYIKPIINDKDLENMGEYNEFLPENQLYMKLFLDIDMEVEDYNKDPKFSGINNHNVEGSVHILKFLQELISNLTRYLINNFQLQKITESGNIENTVQPQPSTSKKNIFKSKEEKETENDFSDRKAILKDILSRVSVTHSNKPTKFSYHVFFNNILISTQHIGIIKASIEKFKTENLNPLASKIDTQVYRRKTSLRFVYSKKNQSSIHYHIPYVTYYDDEIGFNISVDELLIDENNITDYLFTYINEKEDKFLLKSKIKNKAGSTPFLDCEIDLEKINNGNFFKLADAEHLTLKMVLHTIFSQNILSLLSSYEGLKNITSFDERLYKDTDKNFLEFDYNKTKCLFCPKTSHKNKHMVVVNEYGIIVYKLGCAQACTVKSFHLPLLNEYKICEWIYKKDIIKRLTNNSIIVFSEKFGWQEIDDDSMSFLRGLINQYKELFKIRDRETIERMSAKSAVDAAKAIASQQTVVDINYHDYFKFSNGVLNMKTGEFRTMSDSKEWIVINGVSYPYISREDYTEKEKKLEEYLKEVLDQILPITIKDEINKDREIFEKNVSTTLLSKSKDIITIFQGETSAGKSTIKHLIAQTLGSNFIELPISIYTTILEPNKPNPWLGKINLKLVSFASESGKTDKINAQTVKLMTEVMIQGRVLHSNAQTQTNCLTQFIDTNHVLEFDEVDPAVLRRWAVVNFRTHFKSSDSSIIATMDKRCLNGSLNLKNDILNGLYRIIFFNILYDWIKKYDQINNLSMEHTADSSHYSLFTKYLNSCFIESGVIPDESYIKEEVRYQYSTKKLNFNGKKTKILVTGQCHMQTYLEAVIVNKGWKVDVISILRGISAFIQNKTGAIYTFVFIGDIKEEYLDEVMEEYNKLCRAYKKPEFSLNYYKENATLHIKKKNNIMDSDSDF